MGERNLPVPLFYAEVARAIVSGAAFVVRRDDCGSAGFWLDETWKLFSRNEGCHVLIQTKAHRKALQAGEGEL